MTRRPSRLVVGVLLVLAACTAAATSGETATATGPRRPPRRPPPPPPPTPPGRCPPATEPSCPTIPPRAQPRSDRPRYVLHADVRPAEGKVEGDLRVAFTPDLPTDEIVFRLWPNGPRSAASGARLDTGPVTVNGAAAPSTRVDDTTLVVDPGRTMAAGATVEIALNWVLVVPGSANDRISRDGDAMRLGSFFPILPWEPGVGWAREAAVGEFAEASTAPTADFDLTVTVPPGYNVLASGEPAADNDPAEPLRRPRPARRGHVRRPVHRPGHRRRPRPRPGDGHRRPPRRDAGRRQPLPRPGGRRPGGVRRALRPLPVDHPHRGRHARPRRGDRVPVPHHAGTGHRGRDHRPRGRPHVVLRPGGQRPGPRPVARRGRHQLRRGPLRPHPRLLRAAAHHPHGPGRAGPAHVVLDASAPSPTRTASTTRASRP